MRILHSICFTVGLLMTCGTASGESVDTALRELERSGAIRSPQPPEVARWIEGASSPFRSRLSPNYQLNVSFDFAITRAITLPPGLTGAHARTFLLLPGVAAPRGDAGHSCIARMDGFAVNSAVLCLPDQHEAIERLRARPAGQGCRVIDPPAKAWVAAISGYEPEGAVHEFRSKRIPVPVQMRVLRPGDVVLVLDIYEPAIWRIAHGPETRIAAVVLTGNYRSSVEGIGANVPVLEADYEGREQRQPPAAGCEAFYGHASHGYQGGPNTMLLDGQTRALTGRSLDSLTGDYKLKQVDIR